MSLRAAFCCLPLFLSLSLPAADRGGDAAHVRELTTSDGVRLHARVRGDGPTCIFVHGGPGQGSRSFERMGGEALHPFVRMIYLDQRGSGASANARDYHLDRMVQDLDEVRKAFGADRVCLIAHSFGGILATAYAKRHAEHVSSLIMLNAAVHYHSPYNARMRIALADRLTGSRTEIPESASHAELQQLEGEALQRLAQQGLGYRLLSEDPAVQTRMREIDGSYPRTLDFGTNVVRNKERYPEYYRDHSDTTAQVKTPVLVLTGDRDYAVGPLQYTGFRFPDQTVQHIDSGHLMYYEESQQVAHYICAFLAEKRIVPDRRTCPSLQ